MVTVDGCLLGKGSKTESTTTNSDLIQSQSRNQDGVNRSFNTTIVPSSTYSASYIRRQGTMATVHTSTGSSRSGSGSGDDGISSVFGHGDGDDELSGQGTTGNQVVSATTSEVFIASLGNNFKILRATDPVRELQTIIRDKNTSRSDFVFYADRLVS